MSRKLFTADWHLGMTDILRFDKRPFKTIEKHDAALVRSACERANEDDMIIHAGDLFSMGLDRGSLGRTDKPFDVIKQIPAQFINIRGNHDLHNDVKSLCESMRIYLSRRFPDVSISHYPSYDPRAKGQFHDGEIHLCGHVHHQWKHFLDLKHSVLNINIGVDMWNYRVITDIELIQYIESVLRLPKAKLKTAL